jgi:hypothetical protein
MKKALILSSFILLANTARAQEIGVEAAPFYQDKTFLMLAGGAVFLIIVLIVKKVLEKRGDQEEENYEDSNL